MNLALVELSPPIPRRNYTKLLTRRRGFKKLNKRIEEYTEEKEPSDTKPFKLPFESSFFDLKPSTVENVTVVLKNGATYAKLKQELHRVFALLNANMDREVELLRLESLKK